MGEFLAAGMIGGMVGGSIMSNSGKAINSSCKGYEDAKKTLKDTTDKWSGLVENLAENKAKLKDFGIDLKTKQVQYKNQMHDLRLAFKQQEINTVITVAVFILCIAIGFILRYFNVFSNIWHLFVK